VFRLATRRAAVNDDVDAELAFHFEMAAADLERRGLSPDAARAEARRRFGDVESRRSELRAIDARHDRARQAAEWLHGLAQDLRVAARTLARAPGFAAVVVLTLALGVGANAMMFGIVDRLLVRPPAYLRDADRTGRVYFGLQRGGVDGRLFDRSSYAAFRDLERGTAGALDLVGVSSLHSVVGDGAQARAGRLGMATGLFWAQFDMRPALGRFFGPADDRLPAGTPVAVLGYDYWRSAYGGDASVLGRSVRLGGATYTVIGVAPEHFAGYGLTRVDAWVPMTAGAYAEVSRQFATRYTVSWLSIIARRRAGVGVEAAGALLSRATAESWRKRPDVRDASTERAVAALYPVLVDRGPERSTGARVAVWVLGVAAIVLLVACANVANLLLARALRREREVAVRVALGVGRARLVRQLLAEVALLAALGAAVGLLLARAGGTTLTRVIMPDIEWGEAATLGDGRRLLVAAAIALGAGLLASLVPAARALRPDVVRRLRGGARDGGSNERHGRLRGALVLAQATLCALLLVGAGLFVRSLWHARELDFGYEPERVALATVNLRGARLDSVVVEAMYARVAERLRALPFVEGVATTREVPFYQGHSTDRVRLPGRDSATAGYEVHGNAVSGDYFRVMGTRLLRGRVWDARDPGADAASVVVSARLAQILWGDADPLGKCAIVEEAEGAPCRTVVGVVADQRLGGDPRSPGSPGYYVTPLAGERDLPDLAGVLVRTRGPAAARALDLQRALQPLVPGESYAHIVPVAELVAPQLRPWQLGATLFTTFGALGLLVAAVGLYSVLAHDVAQRHHDIGVRLALGARAGDVLRLVVRRGVGLAVVGVAAGIALALVAARRAADLLFEVSPHDPATLAGVAAVLVAAALAASLVPGWRASRIDPAVSLRAD
jgi:predicted permease